MKKSVIGLMQSIYWVFYIAIVLFVIALVLKMQNSFNTLFFLRLTFASPVTILVFVAAIAGFYLHYLLLFKRYYLSKKILQLVFFSGLYSLLVALGSALLMQVIFGFNTLFNDGLISFSSILLTLFVVSLFHGIIGLVLRGFVESYSDITVKKELIRRNSEAELALIHSQLNPHFLFNTISNIDVLIQADPVKASEYLNRLSELLRFALYETEALTIPLQKEIDYIKKYISLQKIRTSNQDYVSFTEEGDVKEKLIAPMLFIPFIENAFKHSEPVKAIGFIRIGFSITGNTVQFECSNSYAESAAFKPESGGKGNALLQKRLELLYPNNYQLSIVDENSVYTVKLKIMLDDNYVYSGGR